jgi:hypothetical protein
MIMKPKCSLLLAISLLTFLASSTQASSRNYKNAVVHADDSAWYVGTWVNAWESNQVENTPGHTHAWKNAKRDHDNSRRRRNPGP